MEKIKFEGLSFEDLQAISNATAKYADTLSQLKDRDNTSQQHIHLSVLNEFRFEVVKKLTKRELPKNPTFKMEVHTAFVVYDALQHYSNHTRNPLEAAQVRRMIIELFSLLPSASDNEHLSIMSRLNHE